MIAQELFVRWVTGPDENCPIQPHEDPWMVPGLKGLYKRKNGSYSAFYNEEECVDRTTYVRANYYKWLMEYCLNIEKEVSCS